MNDLLSIIWTILWSAASDWFMNSDLSLLIYLSIITIVICYFSNLVRMLRRF